MTENQINKIDLMENNLGSDVNVIPKNSNKKEMPVTLNLD